MMEDDQLTITPAESVGFKRTTLETPAMAAAYDSGFIKWQLENKELIKEIAIKLKGLSRDPVTFELKQMARPLMSDEGINWIIWIVETLTYKLFQLTNYSQDDIEENIERFEHELVSHLFIHAKAYNFNYSQDMRIVHLICRNIVEASMKRSLNFGTMNKISVGFKHTEQETMQQQGKQSFFSKYLPTI